MGSWIPRYQNYRNNNPLLVGRSSQASEIRKGLPIPDFVDPTDYLPLDAGGSFTGRYRSNLGTSKKRLV